MASTAHVTIAEVRAEGITLAMAADATITAATDEAVDYLQNECGLTFEPVAYGAGAPLLADGTGHDTVWLPHPIISVTEAGERSVASTGTTYTALETYKYHAFDGRQPGADERENPRLQRIDGGVWPEGVLNIYAVGSFGWTELADDPDAPGTDIERAPPRVRRAEMLLIINDLLWDLAADNRPATVDESLRRWIVTERTEGHSYSLSALAASGGASGIREVDRTISFYQRKRPRHVGA